ncbi:hypothetical protein ACFLXA_01440 [Chloroflexota bacterium]
MGYLMILAAIPGYFFSFFVLMLLWGVIAPKLGIVTVSYPMAMLITITIWLTIAPLVAVGQRARRVYVSSVTFK